MKNNEKLNQDQKMEYWTNHVMNFKKTGLTQKKYCEREKFHTGFRTWYYKNRKKQKQNLSE